MKQSEITTRSAKIVFAHVTKEALKKEFKGMLAKLLIGILLKYAPAFIYKLLNIAQVQQAEDMGVDIESDISNFDTHML
jgi:hypothetical protein